MEGALHVRRCSSRKGGPLYLRPPGDPLIPVCNVSVEEQPVAQDADHGHALHGDCQLDTSRFSIISASTDQSTVMYTVGRSMISSSVRK